MQAERQANPSLKKSGMRQLGYESVFWRIRLTQLALFGAAFAAVVLYGGLNLHLLLRQAFRL